MGPKKVKTKKYKEMVFNTGISSLSTKYQTHENGLSKNLRLEI